VGRITLIIGGSRSGKSAHALKLASERVGARRAFIATAEVSDEEMASRIARHRAERPADFTTVEEPIKLANAIASLQGRADVAVIDSLTLWVSNLMQTHQSEEAFAKESDALAHALKQADLESIVVTDEVGGGIVPANAIARAYRDLLGLTNQRIARAADEVLLMVAGYPLKVK
jgi:adenosylcobinamide kinase / adenosylcobinamide-phosphate guanylyltransferase